MPLIEGQISELSDETAIKLEQAITATIRETVAAAFPPELGFEQGSEGYTVGLEVARKIMPGWTWVTLVQQKVAIQGKRLQDAIVARINILILQNALEPQYKDEILEAVTKAVREVLGAQGKKVHLAISLIEGGVDMTLPRELFGDMMQTSSEELLAADNVRAFLIKEIMKELQTRQQLVH